MSRRSHSSRAGVWPYLRTVGRPGLVALSAVVLLAGSAVAGPSGSLEEEPPGTSAPRTEAATLTLERAIELATATSHRLKAADARVASAEAGTEEAKAGRLPRLELAENFVRSTNPVVVFGNLLRQESFTEENFELESLNRPAPLNNFGTEVTLHQTVWSGGEIRGGIEAATSGLEASVATRERTRQEVVHQVIGAYANAVVARHSLIEAEASRAVVAANLDLVRSLYEGGLVVESDLLQVMVRESELSELVIRAESAVAISLTALNLAIGLEPDRPWELVELVDNAAETAPPGIDELTRTAALERPDLKAAAAEVEAAQGLTRMARAGYFPSIGLGGGWEANAEGGIGADGTNWSVMAGLKWTAFDGFATRARVRRAREGEVEAAEMREHLGQQISLEVRKAWFDVRAAAERRAQATRSIELASRSMEIVRDRYREGLTTLVEFQESEASLTRARARSVVAMRDLLVAKATLELAAGRL